MKYPWIKNSFFVLGILIAVMLVLTMLVNRNIQYNYAQYLYSKLETVPARRVGLVLGIARRLGKSPSAYYKARIEAAASLYHVGKIKKIVVSGGETPEIKADLIVLGVLPKDITVDLGGANTLLSVLRVKEVFGVSAPMIIAQSWHNRRALFLARNHGIQAIAFAAADERVTGRSARLLGELIARFKAGVDVWIFRKNPEFKGEFSPIL